MATQPELTATAFAPLSPCCNGVAEHFSCAHCMSRHEGPSPWGCQVKLAASPALIKAKEDV